MLMSLFPAGQIHWAEIKPWPKPFLRLVLFGEGSIDRFEIVGPNGETKVFTAQEIWEELNR